jgi:hypothetical protein
MFLHALCKLAEILIVENIYEGQRQDARFV